MQDDRNKNKRATDANRDPLTGEPGAHPVGAGIGAAAGGAATGAAIGSIAGPIGTAAGIVGGAIIGGLAGKGVAEAVNPTTEEAYWREHHSRQWFGRNRTYEDYSGGYRTGYEGYSKYGSARDFDESESDLQRDYERNRGNSTMAWADAKNAARVAWHKVRNRWERLISYDVEDQTGNKIGSIHNLWADDNGQPTFLGVKTGWLFGKNHVVPVHTATVNHSRRMIRLPFSEQKIKEAPAFDADSDLSDTDEERIYAYYNLRRPNYGIGTAGNQTRGTGIFARQMAPTGTTTPPSVRQPKFEEQDAFVPLRSEEVGMQNETTEQATEQARFGQTGKPREGTPRYEPKERSKR